MPPYYPKSRLPGPAVRLFDLDISVDAETTVIRSAHDATTVAQRPEVEWALTDECREEAHR
jgi:hypothetical protein